MVSSLVSTEHHVLLMAALSMSLPVMLGSCCRGQLGREGGPAWAACLTNTQAAPVALRQGEELFIDYFTTPMDAAKRFLTYGFV